MEIDNDLYYTKEHEWIRIEDGKTAIVGITDYAQDSLGDITFIELPAESDEVDQFEQMASLESVKAASDIYSPMSGTVIAANSELDEDPGLINKSPYEKGWITKIELTNPDEKSNLMNAQEYQNYLESSG